MAQTHSRLHVKGFLTLEPLRTAARIGDNPPLRTVALVMTGLGIRALMSKPTDIRICEVAPATGRFNYRTPIKFGGRVVKAVELLDVHLTVETRDGRKGAGFGSMPIGNVWAWPSTVLPAEKTESAMTALGQQFAAVSSDYTEFGHPLEITHELASSLEGLAREKMKSMHWEEQMPRLAQLVSASPLMAAIHDAYGKLLGQNSYNVLGREYVNTDISHYLNDDFKGKFLDQYTLRDPKPSMPLYHLVGALDPLTEADIENRLDDGMPETLSEWISADGLTHLKIKLSGEDLQWDIDRVSAVEKVAAEAQLSRRCTSWWYSCDFNEKCANVDYVLEFLHRVGEESPSAWERIQYIEQPTHRDLKSHPENRMHEAAKLKPVVIDESLVDFESLLLSREMGYSGVALKACKGHSEALLMGAAAQKYGLFLCIQDLTCPGASFLHSASLAARIPTVAAIEGNARQYCPVGNREWSDRFPSMFHITDGTLGTHVLSGPGLGF